jgi:hypothetical protein
MILFNNHCMISFVSTVISSDDIIYIITDDFMYVITWAMYYNIHLTRFKPFTSSLDQRRLIGLSLLGSKALGLADQFSR